MIKLCDSGHITGLRTCWCGSKTTPQAPPFTEFPEVTAARLKREARARELRPKRGSFEAVRRMEQSARDRRAAR